MIFHQGDKAPQRRRKALPRTVVVQLAGVDELPVAGQRPVHLAITDAGLRRAAEEVEIRYVQVNAFRAHPAVQFRQLVVLVPLRIVQPLMVGMTGGGADIAGIGTVVLETHHAGLLEESLYLAEIFISPVAAQAGGTAKGHPASPAGTGIDHVHLVADPTAGQQRIATQFNAFAPGIVHQRLELGDILPGDVFGIGTRTEAQDNHLIARLGALVHGTTHRFGIAGGEVHEDGILGGPRGNGTVETAGEQSFPFAVVTVKRHFVDTEGAECAARLHRLVGTQGRGHFQDAARLQEIVALRGVGWVLHPVFRDVRLLLGETALALVVALHMDVGQQEGGRVSPARRFRFGKGQLFQFEAVHIDRQSRPVEHLHPFPDHRYPVVDSHVKLQHDTAQGLVSP